MGWPRFRISERQVLLWIMASLFLAYAATFIVASLRKREEPVEVNQTPRVRRMPAIKSGGSGEPDIRYRFEDLFDPSLMALPNKHGFSQRLWSGGPLAGLAPSDWNIRPSFLPGADVDRLKVLLEEPALTQIVETVAEKRPAADDSGTNGAAFAPARATNSFVSIVNGTLTGRELLSSTSLPAVTNQVALRPTRVRVAVDPEGAVRFVGLERGCGQETVDVQALNRSQQLHFTPLTGDAGKGIADFAWGVVLFVWATVPPSSTNAVAASPPVISTP